MDDKENQIPAEPYDNADVPPENNAVPTQVSELSVENRSSSELSITKSKTFEEYCRESVILGFIISLCTYVAKLFRKSLTASVFTSYQSTAKAFSSVSLSATPFPPETIISLSLETVRTVAICGDVEHSILAITLPLFAGRNIKSFLPSVSR